MVFCTVLNTPVCGLLDWVFFSHRGLLTKSSGIQSRKIWVHTQARVHILPCSLTFISPLPLKENDAQKVNPAFKCIALSFTNMCLVFKSC